MKSSFKRALAPILGDYQDQGKWTYRMIKSKMEAEGLDLKVLKFKKTKDGEFYWDSSSMTMEPKIFYFLRNAINRVSRVQIINNTLETRRKCYMPYWFEDEEYSIDFKTKNNSFSFKGRGKEFSQGKVGLFSVVPESLISEALNEREFLITIKILKRSPDRDVLEQEFFKTKAYVHKILDPEKLWDSISLMDIKLERLRLHGVDIKARDANFETVLAAKNKSWHWTNFGIKDVLVLENIVECFNKEISNEKLFSEWPHEEAGVYVRWHQLVQGLLSQNEPLILF